MAWRQSTPSSTSSGRPRLRSASTLSRRPGIAGKSVPKMHLAGEPLEADVGVVVGEALGGQARELDPDVLEREREERRGVVGPPAPAVRHHDAQLREVADHVRQQRRVRVAVRRPREVAGAAVEDHGDARLLAARVHRVQVVAGRVEPAVHRVQLQRHAAERQLAVQLAQHREVQVRVERRDHRDARGIGLDQREHVLDRLHAGDARAVLAHQQGDVDALLVEVREVGRGVGGAVGAVQRLHRRAADPRRGPRRDRQRQRAQPHDVLVDVDDRHLSATARRRRTPSAR